jgi:hypothetical protein
MRAETEYRRAAIKRDYYWEPQPGGDPPKRARGSPSYKAQDVDNSALAGCSNKTYSGLGERGVGLIFAIKWGEVTEPGE